VLGFVVLCLGAFLIGLSKAGFGGGAGMVVTPLLALVLPPRVGLGLMLPLLLTTDLMALVWYRGQWDRHSVAILLPPSILGIALGGYLLQLIPSDLLVRLMGLFALVFASLQLDAHRRSRTSQVPRFRPWVGVAFGFAAGVTSTLAHLGGILTTIFLLPRRLGPAQFVATGTVVFVCMNLAKLPPYIQQGLLPFEVWRQAALLFPALVAGVLVGFTLNGRVSPKRFNLVVLGIVFCTGIYLLARPAARPAHADRHPLPLQSRRL
jgi:uncharacterized membrane protein YfcA